MGETVSGSIVAEAKLTPGSERHKEGDVMLLAELTWRQDSLPGHFSRQVEVKAGISDE